MPSSTTTAFYSLKNIDGSPIILMPEDIFDNPLLHQNRMEKTALILSHVREAFERDMKKDLSLYAQHTSIEDID
jgi:hypothetical protein